MYEKMTAVWLIILTIIVCGAVPTLMIFLTTIPSSQMSLYAYLTSSGVPASNLQIVY
jgi:cytochrome b561